MFVRTPTDARAHFFAMSFNGKANLVSFVDPPSAVVNSLGLYIRAAFPRRILNEHMSDDGVFTITLDPGINGMQCLLLYIVFLSVSFSGVMILMAVTVVIFSNGRREKSFFGTHTQMHQPDGIQT